MSVIKLDDGRSIRLRKAGASAAVVMLEDDDAEIDELLHLNTGEMTRLRDGLTEMLARLK